MAGESIVVLNESNVVVVENKQSEAFYVQKDKDGGELFKCKLCELSYKTAKGVRQHITRSHTRIQVGVKRKTDDESIVDNDKVEGEKKAKIDDVFFCPGPLFQLICFASQMRRSRDVVVSRDWSHNCDLLQ